MTTTAQSLAKWWERPFNISDVQLTPDEAQEMGADGLAAWMAEMGFTAVQIALPEMAGGEGTFLRAACDEDFYRDYLAALHARGIAAVPYLNVHWLREEEADAHPEWLQRLEDGEPSVPGYGAGVSPCVNSPWRDWALAKLREMIPRYGLDGIFLDGPAFYPRTCYCEACAEAFHEKFSGALPAWGSWGTRGWADFLDFRAESIERFVADCSAVASESGIALYMNNVSLSPMSWIYGNETRRLAPHLDILGNERANLYRGSPLTTPTWMPTVAAQALEPCAAGKPRVIYCCFRHLPWNYYPLTPVEMELFIAGVLAAGANPHIMGGKRYLAPLEATVRRMLHFNREHGALLGDTEPASRIAVLWSDSTSARYLAPGKGSAEQRKGAGEQINADEFYGCCELLTRAGAAFHLLDENAVEERGLTDCTTVFLPHAACVSEGLVQRLKEFLAEGGKLIGTFDSLTRDERAEQGDGRALSEVFGCTTEGEYLEGPARDFIEVCESVPELSQSLLPSPTRAVKVRCTDGKMLAWHYEPLPSAYYPLAQPAEPIPAIVEKHHPGGGRAVLFTGTFFGAYWHNRFPDYLKLVKALCLDEGDLPVQLEGAPQSVQIVLRRHRSQPALLIHLLNHTGEMQRPIESVLPLREVTVRISESFLSEQLGGEIGRCRASALPEDEDVPVSHDQGSVTVHCPTLSRWLTLVVRQSEPREAVARRR